MARRKLETFEDFNRALKNKYGIGERENYKPWLRVQDVKSKGVRSIINGLKIGRKHHTLSSIETEFFYLAEYCDSIIDIREQFPLVPINLTLKIAKLLEVDHPQHPTSKEPIVMTTDFLLTKKTGDGLVYEAFSVKSENEFKDSRVLEKIEIERVWWEILGVKFSLYTGNELTQCQSRNVNWATHPIRANTKLFSPECLEKALTLVSSGKHLIQDICNTFIAEMQIPRDNALNILRSLIGLKAISVDLSYPLEQADIIVITNVSTDWKVNFDEYC